ncbi:mastermind-like domain-containing protein 1 isoform X2 [Sycon ciliatum]|uniref:mastermind-like domain-containing protein 1 isoform X2 n=1 Tax=Sycon ciliatum TaxID=27933 RepID=UPI0031F70B51
MADASRAPRAPVRQLSHDQITQLAGALGNAISRGDQNAAAEVARNLAAEHSQLVFQPKNAPAAAQPGASDRITLTVHIEDRMEVADKPKVTVKIWPGMTFLELKLMFYDKYDLPVECQRWIHNKSMKSDRDTLASSGITASGHTLFLYLLSKEAAHLPCSRQDYRPPNIPRAHTSAQQPTGTGATNMQPSSPAAYIQTPVQMEPQPLPTHMPLEPNMPRVQEQDTGAQPNVRQQAADEPFLWRPPDKKRQVPPVFNAEVSSSNPAATAQQLANALPMNIPMNIPMAGPPPHHQQQQQYEHPLYEHQQYDHQQPHHQQPQLHQPPQQQQQQQQQHLELRLPTNDLALTGNGGGTVAGGSSPAVVAADSGPLLESSDEIPEDGWNCPVCTLRNHPTRPGCSACTKERPADYVLPERYDRQEEIIRAQVRAEQERLLTGVTHNQAQGAPGPGQGLPTPDA